MTVINDYLKKIDSPEQRKELLKVLKAHFEKNMNRHKGLEWTKVRAKLDPPAGGEKLWSLNEMERTGGEQDVVVFDKKTGHLPANGRAIPRVAETGKLRYKNVKLVENLVAPSLLIAAMTMSLCSITVRTLTMTLERFVGY